VTVDKQLYLRNTVHYIFTFLKYSTYHPGLGMDSTVNWT